MSFVVRSDPHDCVAWLEVGGRVEGRAAAQLSLTVCIVLVAEQPDELIIDLHEVNWLSDTGTYALAVIYRTAIECGTRFRIVNANGQVLQALRAAGVAEAFADSDDNGALLLGVLNTSAHP